MEPTTPTTFTLRRLELVMPFTKAMKEGDPKAMVNVAAIALADEETLKLHAAGNTEILKAFVDKAYAMDPFEVAALLANFTAASARFSLMLSGYSAEEISQLEAKKQAKVAALLRDASASPSVDTWKP